MAEREVRPVRVTLSLRLKLTLANVAMAIAFTCALGAVGFRLQQQTYLANLRDRLTSEAELTADVVADALADAGAMATAVQRLATTTGARITVVDPAGAVLADSHGAPAGLDARADRGEIGAALAGRRGEETRVDAATGEAAYHVAAPIRVEGRVGGAVRLSVPLTQIDAALRQIGLAVLGLTALAAVLTALITLAVTRILTVPLRELNELVSQATAGQLTRRVAVRSSDELGQLTASLNQMTAELDTMFRAISQQRNEMSAILAGITDGILIVDTSQRIQRANQTALDLVASTSEQVIGRLLIEVTRDHELAAVVAACLERGTTTRQVIERGMTPRTLSVIATPIAAGDLAGALVTLHDVSELRRLEQARRQFVANISHELRTPLSTIKLMVETIQEDPGDLDLATSLLDRINAEVDSLTQLVRELLELSRLESGQVPLTLTWQSVERAVGAAVERLRPSAERYGVALTAEPALADLPAVLADAERLQGVLVNLIHNAIKFTPAGGEIVVGGAVVGEEVRVWVRDTGIGIPPSELARVFERFYKVDKARASGGTGLGLAIVKHTIQAHGGRVWAESAPGRGSTFIVALPLERRPVVPEVVSAAAPPA